MKISFASSISKTTTNTVLFIDSKTKVNDLNLSDELKHVLDNLKKNKLFDCEYKSSFFYTELNKSKTKNYLFVGIGDIEELNKEKRIDLGAYAHECLKKNKVKVTPLLFTQYDLCFINCVFEGFYISNYNYAVYKTGKSLKKLNDGLLTSCTIVSDLKKSDKEIINDKIKLIDSVHFTKNLVVGPSNVITPMYLAEQAKKMAKKFKALKVKIHTHKDLVKMKMGLILAVSQGTDKEGHLIELEWNPKKSKEKPIILVGKGITYDTGGYNLKPSAHINGMHFDMGGAASVFGAMDAIASLNIQKRVIMLVPTTPNLVSTTAYRPNDIITSYSKKTVEILNTDAEGRLVLADALHYATEKKPECIIDLATLTGAIVAALGYDYAGLFTENEELAQKLMEAGKVSGDEVWRMPLTEKHRDRMKSDIADLKNISASSCGAGSATAAGFLSHFVGKEKWAHIDIAGAGWYTPGKTYHTPGGFTGYGVKILVEFIKNY